VRLLAARKHQQPEEVFQELLNRSITELPVDQLPDEQVLELADMQLPEEQQSEFSTLLEGNRENTLTPADRKRLDELMNVYSQGMIRKSEALKVAVRRGLRPPAN
jgi:hypothetical protein